MNDKDHNDRGCIFARRYNVDSPLRIGTRQSPLAIAQAQMVRAALLAQYDLPSDSIILVPMLASGDKIIDRPLASIGGKALWTKELERAQINDEIDIAVHSMKDVETLRPDIFTIAAMLPRAVTYDKLIGAPSIASLKQGARIGTSSPRRKAQILSMRSDLVCKTIRGNVATRLGKINSGEFDATLLAGAGLIRLGLADIGTTIENMLPAASQGAIGIECLSSRDQLQQFISAINHQETMICVRSERAFLAHLNGDCHSPIAALAQIIDQKIYLRGQILLPDGSDEKSDVIESRTEHGNEAAHTLATRLLENASPALSDFFTI